MKTYTATSGFLCVVGDPNSGLHACAVRNLPTEAITPALNLASYPEVFDVCVFWLHTPVFLLVLGLEKESLVHESVSVYLEWVFSLS